MSPPPTSAAMHETGRGECRDNEAADGAPAHVQNQNPEQNLRDQETTATVATTVAATAEEATAQTPTQTKAKIQTAFSPAATKDQDLPKQPDPDITPPTTVHPHIQTDPPHSLIPTTATSTIAASGSIATTTAINASGAFSPPAQPNMIFSDIYKTKIRRQSVQFTTPYPSNTPDWVAEEYADLLSRDKAKQKEAVRRYLTDKVKTDWEFQWPSRVVETPVDTTIKATVEKETSVEEDTQKPASDNDVVQDPVPGNTETVEPVQDEIREDPGYQVDSDAESEAGNDDDDDAQSVYSTVSEDPLHYKARLEWASDFSDDEDSGPLFRSPFRFDTPETVGPVVQESLVAKRAKRRRAVRDEMKWNEGLACFEARRNAWTGARTVRVRPKPVSPPAVSPRSPRRFFFRRSISSSPPTSTHMAQASQGGDGSDGSSIAKGEDGLRKSSTKDTVPSTPPDTSNYMVETLVPIGQPLLPPNNPLRASITPSVYINLYEKVILHNLQPSCPINLTDMLRSCVAGWKRDGEWPPRSTPAPPSMAARKKKKAPKPEPAQKERSGSIARRMSLGLLGRDDETGTGKGIRRSIVRALGIGANGTQESTTTPSAPATQAA